MRLKESVTNKHLPIANISKLGVSGLIKVSTFNQNFYGLTVEWLGKPSLLIFAIRWQKLSSQLSD